MKCLVFTLIAGLACVMLTSTAAAQNLVIYFNFDEGGGDTVTDGSGNGNNGAIMGESEWTDGKEGFGGALEFFADPVQGHVRVEDSDSLKIGGLTAAAWIFDLGDAPYPFKLIGQAEGRFGVLEGWVCGISGNGHVMYPEIQDTDLNAISFQGPEAIPTGEWAHLAWTYSVAEQTLTGWVNGEVNHTRDIPGKPIRTNFDTAGELGLIIGAQPWNPGAHGYHGIVDEVAVYDDALTQDQIMALMDSPTAVEPSGKLATTWASLKNK